MEDKKLSIKEVQQALYPYIISECKWSSSYRNHKDILVWSTPTNMHMSDITHLLGREDWIKPELIPLSDITDEHAMKIGKMYKPIFQGEKEDALLPIGKQMIKAGREGARLCYQTVVYQQLIIWGYAVPLFFGLGHWANGKTAIELGIAINKNNQASI